MEYLFGMVSAIPAFMALRRGKRRKLARVRELAEVYSAIPESFVDQRALIADDLIESVRRYKTPRIKRSPEDASDYTTLMVALACVVAIALGVRLQDSTPLDLDEIRRSVQHGGGAALVVAASIVLALTTFYMAEAMYRSVVGDDDEESPPGA